LAAFGRAAFGVAAFAAAAAVGAAALGAAALGAAALGAAALGAEALGAAALGAEALGAASGAAVSGAGMAGLVPGIVVGPVLGDDRLAGVAVFLVAAFFASASPADRPPSAGPVVPSGPGSSRTSLVGGVGRSPRVGAVLGAVTLRLWAAVGSEPGSSDSAAAARPAVRDAVAREGVAFFMPADAESFLPPASADLVGRSPRALSDPSPDPAAAGWCGRAEALLVASADLGESAPG